MRQPKGKDRAQARILADFDDSSKNKTCGKRRFSCTMELQSSLSFCLEQVLGEVKF